MDTTSLHSRLEAAVNSSLLTVQQKVAAVIKAYMSTPDTTDRDAEHFEWFLNEVQAGRK